MKKIKYLLAAILLSAAFLNSCATSAKDEPAISEVASNHMSVAVTKSTVKITLTKQADEDIQQIDVVEVPNGSISSVKMDQNSVSFIWPFAEPSKEYKLCAKIYGSQSYSEEYVTFKTEATNSSSISYSDAYKTSDILLVAKGNERLITINTDFNTINSAISKAKPTSTSFILSLYSGFNYNASSKDSVLVGNIVSKFDKNAVEKFSKGYDIIANAKDFNLTPKELNNALSQSRTYFAVASVTFTLPDYPQNVSFTSKGIYSNDTIYTPVDSAIFAGTSNSQVSTTSEELPAGYAK